MQLDLGSLHRIEKREEPPCIDLLGAGPAARESRHAAIVGAVRTVEAIGLPMDPVTYSGYL